MNENVISNDDLQRDDVKKVLDDLEKEHGGLVSFLKTLLSSSDIAKTVFNYCVQHPVDDIHVLYNCTDFLLQKDVTWIALLIKGIEKFKDTSLEFAFELNNVYTLDIDVDYISQMIDKSNDIQEFDSNMKKYVKKEELPYNSVQKDDKNEDVVKEESASKEHYGQDIVKIEYAEEPKEGEYRLRKSISAWENIQTDLKHCENEEKRLKRIIKKLKKSYAEMDSAYTKQIVKLKEEISILKSAQ